MLRIIFARIVDDFNPRSREGSDKNMMTGLYRYAIFQSTLPRGERLSKLVRFNLKKFISIHAPARGATKERYDIIGKQFGISIHAPARGATRKTFWKTHRHRISIHAPARGATQGTSKDRSNDRNFNPRSREGSDDLRYRILIPAKYISIHAPARGATIRGF